MIIQSCLDNVGNAHVRFSCRDPAASALTINREAGVDSERRRGGRLNRGDT